MQRIETRQQCGDLGQKGIAKDRSDLFRAETARIAHQLADVDFQSRSEPLQRAQRRDRLAVFNFRDISAGHLHPAGKLTLAQVTCTSNIPYLRRYP